MIYKIDLSINCNQQKSRLSYTARICSSELLNVKIHKVLPYDTMQKIKSIHEGHKLAKL